MTGGVLIAINVALTGFIGAFGLSIGVKAGRRAAGRDATQLRGRLNTFVRVLADLPEAHRQDGAYFLHGRNLALLAVLIRQEQRDAEESGEQLLLRPDSDE